MRPKYLLCDLDGTLVDTESLKCEAWRLALGDASGSAPAESAHRAEYRALAGMPGVRIAERLVASHGLAMSAPALWERREVHRRTLYSDPEAIRSRACHEVIGIVRRVREGFVAAGDGKIALVTTAGLDQVDVVLGALRLADLFDVTVCGLEKSAENPACYSEALRLLGATADECLALEDTPAGVSAATALGIPCLYLPNPFLRVP